MATKAIVGEKVGMTQVWDDQNRAIPVTVVRVSPLRVVQVKTVERDGYSALQVTFGTRKASALNTAMEQAGGEILFFTDVRQELSPLSLANLQALMWEKAGIVRET